MHELGLNMIFNKMYTIYKLFRNIIQYLKFRILKTILRFILLTVLLQSSIYVYGKQYNVSDYILVVNTYAENNPWSDIIISTISNSIIKKTENLTYYTEDINALLIESHKDIEEFNKYLFSKYSDKKPKAVVMIGNGAWTFLKDSIDTNWKDIPIILCSGSEYTSRYDTSLTKNKVTSHENEDLISEVTAGYNLTIIQCPVYIKETIDLMLRLKPQMNKLIFISDAKYISSQNRYNVKEIVQRYFPSLKVNYLTEGEINTDMLLDSIRTNAPEEGVLYYSWVQKRVQSGNNYLTANAYKTIGSFSSTPIFTLEDIGVKEGFMAGGHFYTSEDLRKTVSSTLLKILTGIPAKNIPTQYMSKAYNVLNYNTLVYANIPTILFPKNAIYYQKPESIIDKYKYQFLGFFTIIFILFFWSQFKRKQKIQKKEMIILSKYKDLINNMPISYLQEKIIKNESGEIVDALILEANPTFEKEFGKKENVLMKRQIDKHKTYLNIYKRVITNREIISFNYYRKSKDKYYEVLLLPTTEENIIDIFCIDHTQLHKAQDQLETSNHKLSLALEVSNIIPWKWNILEKTIQYDTDQSSKTIKNNNTLTISEEKYLNKIHAEDIDKFMNAYEMLVSGKTMKLKEEFRIKISSLPGNSEPYQWVEIQAAVDVKDKNGKALSLIGSSLIITDRKKMEMDILEAKTRAEESNRLKSAFLANMSHEIRTPLNAIVGFSSIITTTDNEEEKSEYLSIIENNNTLLLQLISDILDLSKIEAGTMEFSYSDIDLNLLLKEIEQASLLKKTIENLELKLSDQLPSCFIHTDKNRLMQVITNMINNALKFTKEGHIHFGYHLKDDYLYFFVEDTGYGIPRDKQNSVFGRFIKLNNFVQGTGLGLSICETIVHRMGGDIGVVSEEGKGSTFWFTHPYTVVNPKVKDDKKETGTPEKVEKNRLKILIAEDNSSNYKLFETILRKEYQLIHAWNGKEAIELFNSHHPHLILMDINMPVLDGYNATSEIRKISATIPIIAITAYAFSADEERVLANGFNEYIAKPINPQTFRTKISDIIQRYIALF